MYSKFIYSTTTGKIDLIHRSNPSLATELHADYTSLFDPLVTNISLITKYDLGLIK